MATSAVPIVCRRTSGVARRAPTVRRPARHPDFPRTSKGINSYLRGAPTATVRTRPDSRSTEQRAAGRTDVDDARASRTRGKEPGVRTPLFGLCRGMIESPSGESSELAIPGASPRSDMTRSRRVNVFHSTGGT